MIIVLGITGRIGSGKSTVSGFIKKIKKNVLILDIDKLAKSIYSKNPEVLDKLKVIFGKKIFCADGKLIFDSLAERVFSSKKDLEKLNCLMFPLIRNKVENILNKNQDKDYIIIDAAVLFDCKLNLFCDYIILVEASVKKRETFLKNKGFSNDRIKLRMKGQHIKIQKGKVVFVIDNDGSKRDLLEKVEKIIKKI
ncbi:MAG TPA: dephospho-CoA kinase [Candidatus Humimicrobiaceae bacterium]